MEAAHGPERATPAVEAAATGAAATRAAGPHGRQYSLDPEAALMVRLFPQLEITANLVRAMLTPVSAIAPATPAP